MLDGAPVLAVDLDGADTRLGHPPPPWLPCVVIGVASRPGRPAPEGVDVAVAAGGDNGVGTAPPGWVHAPDPEAELTALTEAAGARAGAAVMLAQVLRLSGTLDVDAALSVESLAYSTLQSGPAFAAWLRDRPTPPPRRPRPGPTVVAERHDDVLRLVLNRPHVRNAVSGGLRQELCEALAVAAADPSVRLVELRGAGPSFSSGGDLDEFGTLDDPLAAHLVRTARSPARLLAAVSERVTAYVHGAAVGAGIELAAFAGRVVADPAATFALPELGLGLLPGAGGTVSLPRRIGRQRTAFMALRGATLDATGALAWGLVDELAGVEPAVVPG